MTVPSREMIPVVCPNCGKERMVTRYSTKTPSHTGLCQKCNGAMGNKPRRELHVLGNLAIKKLETYYKQCTEQAKREEGERIISKIETDGAITFLNSSSKFPNKKLWAIPYELWQALKEGK